MHTKLSPHRSSRKRQEGQTLTEFAMVLPLLALLLFGIIQFGIVFHQYVTLTDSVRAGGRQGAVSRDLSNPQAVVIDRIDEGGPQGHSVLDLGARLRRDRDGDVPLRHQPPGRCREVGNPQSLDHGARGMSDCGRCRVAFRE